MLHKPFAVGCCLLRFELTSSWYPNPGLLGVIGALLELPKIWSVPAKLLSGPRPPMLARADPGCPVKLDVRCTLCAMWAKLLPLVLIGLP